MTLAQSVEIDDQARATAAKPLVAVVDPDGTLANWIVALGEMFRISVRIMPDANALGGLLEEESPIGVVCGDLGDDGRHLIRTLKLLCAYDRTMPVLLVTPDDPETLGGIDTALELYPMPDVQRVSGPTRIDAIIGFLAHAARQRGTMRLMAI